MDVLLLEVGTGLYEKDLEPGWSEQQQRRAARRYGQRDGPNGSIRRADLVCPL